MKGSLRRTVTESPPEENSPRRGRFPRVSVLTALLVVGAIVVGAAAGVAVASLFSGDTPGEGSGDSSAKVGLEAPAEDAAEAGFARDMMVHHAQAVQIVDIERDRTESEEI